MRELLFVFQDVEDPRRGNAKRHDLHEALVIALLTMLTRAIAKTRTAHKTKRTATVSRTAQLGISTVEYALLAVGVIAIIGALIVLLEGGILGLLDQVSGRMTAAATQ